MIRSSSGKTLLNLISIAIILSCVIACGSLAFMAIVPVELLHKEGIVAALSGIWIICTNVVNVLVPIQIVLMLGIFVFNLRNLREFLGYYLGAFLSLITCAASVVFVLAFLGWILKDF